MKGFVLYSLYSEMPRHEMSTQNYDTGAVPCRLMKQGVWAYFFLLIFEGALRKWVLPGLATPLLIIRDPIALWLIVTAWRKGLFPSNSPIKLMFLVGVAGIYSAVFGGHGNFWVALYGARIFLIQFPLMYVIGNIFSREDVIMVGKVLLWISIPMAVLITFQFYSPQSAWVNRGIGGEGGGGFSGAMGYFRPPATFSFTNGNGLFFAFVGSYLFYFWLYPKTINSFLLFASTAALIIAMPFSISRSLFFHVTISFLFALIAVARKPKHAGKMLIVGISVVAVLTLFSKNSLFQTATEAFSTRFELANEAEGGVKGVLVDRYLGGMVGALKESSELSFWGYGLGMGTNVGSMLLTGGRTFLISEGEWGRVIGELGPLMGLSVIFIRLSFSVQITKACYKKLAENDLLPWMLLSFGLLTVPQAQWAQPTALGFSILIGGLILASLRMSSQKQG